MLKFLKANYIYGDFMKNFRFVIICNITQEPQELQRFNFVPVGSSAREL